MKVIGSTYNIKGQPYLAVYQYQKDVPLMLPPELGAINKAHISYKKGNKDGSVYVFEVNNPESLGKYVNLMKDFNVVDGNCIISGKIHGNAASKRNKIGENLFGGEVYEPLSENTRIISIPPKREVLRNYGVAGQTLFIGGRKSDLELVVLSDILDFCKNQTTKTPGKNRIRSVRKINTKTKLERITPRRILEGGKQDFVDKCKLEANIDFSKGCITSWIPGKNSSFDGEYFYNYFSFPWGECEYCYAIDKHESFPKTIYLFDKKALTEELKGGAKLVFGSEETLGRPVKTLRFGKRTESWTPFTENEFVQTLEAMTETGTRGVIPTKFLPFDKILGDLFIRTNSSALYSVSPFEHLEVGAIMQNSTNEWRMEQARKYREMGVDSQYYLLTTPHLAPGNFERKILEDAEKHKMIVQVLPLRPKSKAICLQTTGQEWNFLKNKNPGQNNFNSFLEENESSYIYFDGQLVLKEIHPEWKKIIGNNKGKVKMCHHDDQTIYCGGCSPKGGGIYKNGNSHKKKK